MNDNINDLPDSWSKIKNRKNIHKSLGKGLDSLLGTAVSLNSPENPTETTENHQHQPVRQRNMIKADGKTVHYIPITDIIANADQPRKNFDEDELKELALSIQRNGVLQPILLRPMNNSNKYEIVAGERRWRATQMAMHDDIPALVHDLSDHDVMELALVENLHRQDLNIIEEAYAYRELINKFDYKQSDLSEILSRSRAHIANILRLLQLPESVQILVKQGKLSFSHAKILAGSTSPEAHAKIIINNQLTVRQSEALLTQNPQKKTRVTKPSTSIIQNTKIAQELADSLGIAVKINNHGQDHDKGKITLHFNDETQFAMIIKKLKD